MAPKTNPWNYNSPLLNPCLASTLAEAISPPAVASCLALPILSMGKSEGSKPDCTPVSETAEQNSKIATAIVHIHKVIKPYAALGNSTKK
jgi:hypothetical protein